MPFTTPLRRTTRSFFILGLVLFALAPVRADAQTVDGEEKADTVCEDGKPPGEDGTCAGDPPHRCPDGSEPKDGTCPEPATEPQPSPCPDGADVCGQIRSCPVETPLPPGSTCEIESAPPAEEQRPVAPAPAAPVDASVFGRPIETPAVAIPPPTTVPDAAVVAGARNVRPQPSPAAAARPAELARTGSSGWLALGAAALIAIGSGLVRASGRRAVRDTL